MKMMEIKICYKSMNDNDKEFLTKAIEAHEIEVNSSGNVITLRSERDTIIHLLEILPKMILVCKKDCAQTLIRIIYLFI